jgi:carbonic anhydrase
MSLKEILETNARFLEGARREVLPESPRKHWVLVSCMDFRLTDFLEKAMGIHRGDALIVRNAGNTITPHDSSVIRSLLAGILLFDIREILVVGHTRCGMTAGVTSVLDRMSALGIPREAVGPHDLREWLGLIPGEAENVRRVVNAIAASALIPKSIAVYGFVIDVDTGALEFVHGRLLPGEAPPAAPHLGRADDAAREGAAPSRTNPVTRGVRE